MPTAVSLSRRSLLDLLAGITEPGSGHEHLLLEDVDNADWRVAAHRPASPDGGLSMWVGPRHTVIASGRDELTVRRIRSQNVPLAILDLLDRHGDLGWWRFRVAGDEVEDVDLVIGAGGRGWMVEETAHATTVTPMSREHCFRRLWTALSPMVAPL